MYSFYSTLTDTGINFCFIIVIMAAERKLLTRLKRRITAGKDPEPVPATSYPNAP
jgi:hypothetical protein